MYSGYPPNSPHIMSLGDTVGTLMSSLHVYKCTLSICLFFSNPRFLRHITETVLSEHQTADKTLSMRDIRWFLALLRFLVYFFSFLSRETKSSVPMLKLGSVEKFKPRYLYLPTTSSFCSPKYQLCLDAKWPPNTNFVFTSDKPLCEIPLCWSCLY